MKYHKRFLYRNDLNTVPNYKHRNTSHISGVEQKTIHEVHKQFSRLTLSLTLAIWHLSTIYSFTYFSYERLLVYTNLHRTFFCSFFLSNLQLFTLYTNSNKTNYQLCLNGQWVGHDVYR